MACHRNMIGFLAICLWLVASGSAESYTILASEQNATVKFSITFPVYGRIEGRFERLKGQLDLDEHNPSKSRISIEIDTTSVNSGIAARDNYLRGPALLDCRQHPKAVFRSSLVRVADRNTLVIWGDLTLRGITRRIAVVARLKKSGRDRFGITLLGVTSFWLTEFGISGLPALFATKLHLTMRVDETRR